MRKCNVCGKSKRYTSFYPKRGGTPRKTCKVCDNAARNQRKNEKPWLANRWRGRTRSRKMTLCTLHPECATIDRAVVFVQGKGICGICGKAVRKSWHMDHIIPVSKSGIHCYLNLQPSHIRCNLRKGNKVLATQPRG